MNLNRLPDELADALVRYRMQVMVCLPRLIWQFVAFGHNEHEIQLARGLPQTF